MDSISIPGIFNDAIGPVMRGPSSSHTAGSHRIGKVLHQLAGGLITKATFTFHRKGSLATSYHTQGSDIGLAAGLLDMEITDPRMSESLLIARQKGIEISFVIEDFEADHPNTYCCHIIMSNGSELNAIALSTGGGLIEFVSLDGYEFNRSLDLPTLFIQGPCELVKKYGEQLFSDPVFETKVFRRESISRKDYELLIIEFNTKEVVLPKEKSNKLLWRFINPVYPVMGYTGSALPFATAGDLEDSPELLDKELWVLAVEYESARSGLSHDEVLDRMKDMVSVIMEAIDTGLAGTEYADRILGAQSPVFFEAMKNKKLLPGGPLERMTAYTMAIMESKSAMEVIIAAPTAGAAGGLPGAIIGMAEELGASLDQITKAFLAAGIIGVFISRDATFSAEVAGCQAETGAGAGMAAAGMIQLANGTAMQALGAASIALQNILGLICDPVANRVEVPCLSRNVQSGANALASANMILGGVDPVIPLSETIKTLLDVGKKIPRELRCTALGGLSVTKTARNLRFLDTQHSS
ncbi:MAG: L-serine ammonia-lyase, iron-sulfur-dependent, subunit alpha [Bacteroidales bacterium]|nr:L-serine ammonia-lyase, iron-sulfur-dependent, subunit alpha [Bacteroidales bacterium]